MTFRNPPARPTMMVLLLAGAALLPVSGGHAAPGGQLRVLVQGPWTCEMPGDATRQATPVPAENFRIAPDSSYYVGLESGNYLRLGDRLTMTSGPFVGRRYRVKSEATVRRLDEHGTETGLRCVRAGAAGSSNAETSDTDAADL